MPSAICFNLNQSEIVSSGNELNGCRLFTSEKVVSRTVDKKKYKMRHVI